MREGLRRSLGRLLKSIRAEKGQSLQQVEELTREAGGRVPRSRLSALERGEAPLQFEDLHALSGAYGIGLFDLFLEALASRPNDRFASDWSAEQLFEEGKRLFAIGKHREAGWAFDEAAKRAGDNTELCGWSLTAAAHCYDLSGLEKLTLSRTEQALDML